MSGKNKIIVVGGMLIILVILSIIFLVTPSLKIDINGKQNQKVVLGSEYVEKGAEAYFKKIFKIKKINVEISGKVNVNKVGKYIVTYKAKSNGMHKEAIRIVNVVDDEKPTITLNQDVKICQKNNLVEIDANSFDNYDKDISDKIKYKLKKDKVILSVTDSSNNKTEIITEAKIIDNEKPTISLNGDKVVYLQVGQTYTDLGATAYDSCDGNISNKIEVSGNVNTEVAGSYQKTYKIEDSIGNEVKISRTIIVSDQKYDIKYPVINGATIYLTFDDGPGLYTEQILNVLDNYNVKATFFVTNQFPNYQDLIKKEYEKGHAIGIHTYSHKWSIYESVDTYLEDFKKIEAVVISQTGVKTKLFRFPGGSSNKVSSNYKKGIMTELAKVMTEKGYIYFDWTFDSGDTSKNNNSKEAIIKNVKNNLKGDGNYIILMHDIKKNTLEALPEIIEYAKYNGYDFDVLTESSPTEHLKIAN